MTMDTVLETIVLDPDETPELLFRVKVEGAGQSPATIRLICEGTEASYVFKGQPIGDDIVQFLLPAMKGKAQEATYLSQVEVVIENKLFVPVKFNLGFKKAVNVVAESVKVVPKRSDLQVSAAPIVSDKKATLKERYDKRRVNTGSALIKELAQSFVHGKR